MFRCVFIKRKKIAQDTWHFLFKRPKKFVFKSGQYVTFFLGNDTRDFTICGNPLDTESFSIITKKGRSDFKNTLFSLKPDAVVALGKPSGGFILKERVSPKVFLAGGVGIAPFYTMIQERNSKKSVDEILLLASFAKNDDICFQCELEKYEKENANVKIVYTLTRGKWKGEEGRISEKLIRKYILDVSLPTYYIAGGVKMVEDTQEMLLRIGVDTSNIRTDIFTGY